MDISMAAKLRLSVMAYVQFTVGYRSSQEPVGWSLQKLQSRPPDGLQG